MSVRHLSPITSDVCIGGQKSVRLSGECPPRILKRSTNQLFLDRYTRRTECPDSPQHMEADTAPPLGAVRPVSVRI